MYGIFTYIYPKNSPNVGKYAIHGASGYDDILQFSVMTSISLFDLGASVQMSRLFVLGGLKKFVRSSKI